MFLLIEYSYYFFKYHKKDTDFKDIKIEARHYIIQSCRTQRREARRSERCPRWKQSTYRFYEFRPFENPFEANPLKSALVVREPTALLRRTSVRGRVALLP